ncbi:MAG: diguanylate cyclase/phosphodiesterase with and sensor(s) [Firmicutes bacterium]|nr:diguanylate cyclase/phosphodiesterase with and sensor(s) [Bacillota bacterium]
MMRGLMRRKKPQSSTFGIEKIRTRLLLIMLILMIISLSFLTVLSYYFSNKALLKGVNETAAAIGTDYSNRVSAFVNELVIFVQDLATNPHIIAGSDRQQIVNTLAEGLRSNNKFTGINYGDLNGNMIRAQGDTAYLGDREYYRKAIQTKKVTISEPLMSRGSGRLSVAIAVPVLVNGNVTAIIQATMPLDSLNEMVQKVKFLDSGYGFIADKSGVLIAHALWPELNGKVNFTEKKTDPGIENTLSEMDDRLIALFKKAVDSGGQVQGIYNTARGSRFTVFTPISLPGDSRWLVAVSAPENEVTREVADLNTILILAAIGSIVVGAFVIVLISARFARPEERYFKAFRHVADATGIVNLTTGEFIEVNDAFLKILGYSREEVIGYTSDEFGLWVNQEKSEMRAVLRAGNAISSVEAYWHAKNGDVRTGIFSADVINVGNELYSVFIWHDITKLKQAERALRQAYDELEYKVEERTEELFAANEELTAVNEEMTAMNEELEQTNQRLYEENLIRRQTEDKLLLRERQYRATTGLLTRSADEFEHLAETVLSDAIQLVKATCGFIGMYNESGSQFVIHHKIGFDDRIIIDQFPIEDGPLTYIYKTGEVLYTEDSSWYLKPQDFDGAALVSSMFMVPLKQEEQVKGILAATWIGEIHEINQDDVEVLRQFADLAFIALERAHIQEKVRHMAFYDILTGLPNRLNLNLRLEEELGKARRGETEGVLLFIDMDDLKTVNDAFGHSAGDKVIIKAGKCLSAAFAGKGFVARISGDEFIVIVPGKATQERAAQIANKALQKLCQEYDVMEAQMQMSASIGVVLYPEHGDVPEEILKKADAAMYAAKGAGRNCWHFFEDSLLQQAFEDMSLINGLRRAMARGELFLYYQPQLAVDGERIVGVEALVRWNSPEHGMVSPARFIPLAERSRLIQQIGKWVLQEACCFAKRLADMGMSDIRVAVNISPKQIKDEHFVANVLDTIEANGVNPQQIEIEVTENVFIENLEDSKYKLKQLQKQGVNLTLDDFGTGFSSLTYLSNLPVNCLKIDKSFIDRIAFDELQLQFVDSIVHLGHTLGMVIVAEGVETKEQLAKLVGCKCDYVQGFLFSKPVPEEDTIQLLTRPVCSNQK